MRDFTAAIELGMDHSTFTYLMVPEVEFLQFYRSDMTPDDLAASVECFVERL